MTAMATHMMRKQIADIGVPEVPEFLEQIVASGGHLWACRMSADMMHLAKDDLYDQVEGIISAADFIEKTEGAQLLFIRRSGHAARRSSADRAHQRGLPRRRGL
jgi:peroxiredoxin family protein